MSKVIRSKSGWVAGVAAVVVAAGIVATAQQAAIRKPRSTPPSTSSKR
jgi:hypothetical protein